jgi:Ser/Thr protein kinase RdoA (MazF antagonist)
VTRGRQANSFEIFTAQEKEYLVQLYPPAFEPNHLDSMANRVNRLDDERFSVVPFLPAKTKAFVGEGPQGSHMLVCLAPAGSTLEAHLYSHHDISQVGLRLAWMHRLLKEQFPIPETISLADRVADALGETDDLPLLSPDERATLFGLINMPLDRGWAHGDLQPSALLLDADRQIRTVVDWGLLHPGCPLEDLVDAFLTLCVDENGRLAEEKGKSLFEAYTSLTPLGRVAWTPVVASWCGQRLLDAAANKRDLPAGIEVYLRRPESLATAIATCNG